MGRTDRDPNGRQGADPFFWVALAALVPAALAALLAPNRAPAYALDATGMYRLEIGLIVFAATYVVGLVLVLAYQGRSLGQLNIANVVETGLPDPSQPDPDLTVARAAFDEFESQATARLDAHDDAFLDVAERLDALQTEMTRLSPARRGPFGTWVRRVPFGP